MARVTLLRTFGLVAVALLAATLTLAGGTSARAQGFGLFGNLFGAPGPQQGAPAYPGYGYGRGYGYGYAPPRQSDSYYYQRPRYHAPRRKAAEQPARDAAPKEKLPPKNASMFVYVLGDSLGQMLAGGLDDAFAARQDVAIVRKARGSTGLVSSKTFDWPKAIDDLLAGRAADDASPVPAKGQTAEGDVKGHTAKPDKAPGALGAPKPPKIDVAVMMIGSNDHQPLDVDGKILQPSTPDWKAAYTKRVMAIDEAFRAKKIPLVWVGVPITKDDDFADAMAGLNDIYRDAAAKTGAIYVDTWEAFSDDDGDFSAYGPDINGQTVRLRAADGVNFTKAGARKLSHFVEVHVSRALEGKTPVPELPTADIPDAKGLDAKGAPKKAASVATTHPEIGPIRNLNELPSATSGSLASVDLKTVKAEDAAASGSATQVTATAAVPAQRADNAKWSGASLNEP